MTATKIQPGDDLHLTSLMAPHSLNFVTGPDRAALLAYGRDVFAAARDSKCLAQIEEPAQPVAEICSASHDDAEFGERAIKPLRDISGFEYGTPLYAGAAPAAVAPQGEYPQLPEGVMFIEQVGGDVIGRPTDYGFKHGRGIVHGAQLFTSEQLRAYFDLGRQQEAGAPGLTDGQLEDESYRVNDEPGFSDAFRAGARFAERVHGVTAAAARALTGEADWWRGRADEIEAQVARSGSKEAMRCYTDMRTLLQAAAPALEAPAAVEFAMAYGGRRVSAYGKRGDPVLLYPDDLARMLAAAPQAPAAPVLVGDGQADAYLADPGRLETLARSHPAGLVRALARAAMAAPAAPAEGEVLVEVIGLTGSGKSAICGEIEILCRALGLDVSWPDGDPEKNMTHAEWTAAIEAYKPRVRIVERNVPRQSNGGPAK